MTPYFLVGGGVSERLFDPFRSEKIQSISIKTKEAAQMFRERRKKKPLRWRCPLLAGESDASNKHHINFVAKVQKSEKIKNT